MIRTLVAGSAAVLISLMPAGAAEFTPAQRGEIVGILRDALRSDPSILRDAVAAMQQAERSDQAKAQGAAILAHAEALLRDPADPVLGNPRGSVTVVEFFDPRCGYCKIMAPAMAELLKSDGNIRLVMKDIPVLGPNSVLASRALLAAMRQNKYAPLHDALMRLRAEPTEAVLQAEAGKLGLDWARLRRDMDDPAIQARLDTNLRLAQALSVEGTPALVIGSEMVQGATDLPSLRQLVARARAEG